MLHIKVLTDPATRRVLGAQIVGRDGVDKRCDVFATAIMGKMTIDQVVDLDLAYSPQYGSAKDPVVRNTLFGFLGRASMCVVVTLGLPRKLEHGWLCRL